MDPDTEIGMHFGIGHANLSDFSFSMIATVAFEHSQLDLVI